MEISIHTLRMEGDAGASVRNTPATTISIHTLRMEGDICALDATNNAVISIHTLRMEGDLLQPVRLRLTDLISIHTLRMEGDLRRGNQRRFQVDFNPHPPHGG